MEITWYGHSCFRLTERRMATVVTDPFDSEAVGYEPLKLKAEIVTVSHDAPGHNYLGAVKGYSHAVSGPCEFEIGGVFITGVASGSYNTPATEHARDNVLWPDLADRINAALGTVQLPGCLHAGRKPCIRLHRGRFPPRPEGIPLGRRERILRLTPTRARRSVAADRPR